MGKDTVSPSLDLLLGAILIFLVFASGVFVVISTNDGGNELNKENVVNAKFAFGVDDASTGKVIIKDLDTEENLKVKIVENTFVPEISNEYLFNMEEESVWISIKSQGETVYVEEAYSEEYKRELINMRGYLLENVIESSDFEKGMFELPFLGRNIIYNLSVNTDLPDENFSYD